MLTNHETPAGVARPVATPPTTVQRRRRRTLLTLQIIYLVLWGTFIITAIIIFLVMGW
jgi:hypothetical protein